MTSIRKSHGLRLQTSIVQDNVPVEVAAGLFVGSIHAAFNVDALKSNKISHVLNLAGSYATFPEDFTYLSLSIRDKEYASLLSCLPIAAIFIDAGMKNGGVLVHCAGGRSRSPAVVMAFLMMKQQISYSAVTAHVKTLRPVVNLNAGFDAQLKCLESARGDVFIANQHLLKARLARLAQQHEDGELAGEVARKRRQSQQQTSHSPPAPLLKKQSSLDMLASGCDGRGMVGERVPSGFNLSLPPRTALPKQTADKAPASSFIPALRSMGTMFGCQSCGENLFCSGAIVHHHELEKLACSVAAGGDSTQFLDALRGRRLSVHTTSEDEAAIVVEGPTKKPILSKLRLRPHSPNVSLGSSTQTAQNIASGRRKSASSVLTKPNLSNDNPLVTDGSGDSLPPPLQVLQAPRRSATEDIFPASNQANGETRKKTATAIEGLWRSLTSFKSSKRSSKGGFDTAKTQQSSRNGPLEMQKPRLSSGEPNSVGRAPAHLVFLKRNAVDWQRSVVQLVEINKSSMEAKTHVSTVDQMNALLDEDSTVLVALNNCSQWFVDPQSWTLDQATKYPEGKLCCPRESCGSIVGEWRWQGLRSDCGGSVTPAFVIKKDAVCVLGNMTSQSTELMAIASSEIHPDKQQL